MNAERLSVYTRRGLLRPCINEGTKSEHEE